MNPKTVNDLWKVNSLRFTIFPKENFIVSDNWWESITGTPPDTISNQPKFQLRHYEGSCESGNFIIETDPVRINLILTQNITPQQQITSFFSLSEYDQIIEKFDSIVEKWLSLPDCPTGQRIAFGGILLSPVNSRIEGYKLIDSLLPSVNINTENSSDFLYQINRPRKSTVFQGNLLINRLSKWLVLRFQTGITQLFNKVPQVSVVDGEYAANLEFDINTDADFQGNFSPIEQKQIYRELRNLCEELAIKGDVE